MRQYDEADLRFLQALFFMPEAADVWFNRAQNERIWAISLYQEESYTEATEHIQKGIQHIQESLRINAADADANKLLEALQRFLSRLEIET